MNSFKVQQRLRQENFCEFEDSLGSWVGFCLTQSLPKSYLLDFYNPDILLSQQEETPTPCLNGTESHFLG